MDTPHTATTTGHTPAPPQAPSGAGCGLLQSGILGYYTATLERAPAPARTREKNSDTGVGAPGRVTM